MISLRKINPMARAVGTMGVVATLVGAVTFASLTSNTVVLADNTISTSASLQISNGGAYSNSVSGFTFSGLVPGGAASGNQTFYLKNNGTTPLSVLTAAVPGLPTFTLTPVGVTDNGQVFINLSCTSGSSGNFSLSSSNDLTTLNTGLGTNLVGGPLAVGDVATCAANVSMSGTAVPGGTQSISSTGFNLNFTGTAN